jgi:hypothetical protein
MIDMVLLRELDSIACRRGLFPRPENHPACLMRKGSRTASAVQLAGSGQFKQSLQPKFQHAALVRECALAPKLGLKPPVERKLVTHALNSRSAGRAMAQQCLIRAAIPMDMG